MNTKIVYHQLEELVNTYIEAAKYYERDETFKPINLCYKMLGGNGVLSKAADNALKTIITKHLHKLAMYGIVNFYGKSNFKLGVLPTDPIEIWKKELGEARGCDLYEIIQDKKSKEMIEMPEKTENVNGDKTLYAIVSGEKPPARTLQFIYGELSDNKEYKKLKLSYSEHNKSKADEVMEGLETIKSGYKFINKGGPNLEVIKSPDGQTLVTNFITFEIEKIMP